jgi:predicted RNase H-like nuclease (RuvC/YqgF family)
MTLLIIGVDPGTTLGYAIITDKGEFLTSGSGKEFGMSELISNIISFGRPLIVGCDKNPPPWFAESLSVKLGAKLFYPKEDLRVNEKREMVRQYDVKLNAHEMDALASAMFALVKHRNFFGKIERFLEQKKKQELEEAVKLIMVRNQDLPLEAALSMAEQKDKEKTVETPRQAVKEAEKNADKSSFSEKMMREMIARIVLLEEENRKLHSLVREKDGLLRRLSKRVLSAPKEELVDYKEQRIKHYTKQLKENTRLVQHYEKEIKRMDDFIASQSKGLLVKKLHDLGSDEFEHKRFLNIGEGDVLLVENPGSISQRVIDELKGKVKVIITNNIPKKGMPGFALLKPEGAILKETKHFAIADKNAVEDALRKKDLLKDILEEYRQERKKEE